MTMKTKAMKYIYWLLAFNAFYGLRCRGFEEKSFPVEGQVSRCREGQGPGHLETSTRGSFPLNVIQEEAVDSLSFLASGTGKEKPEAELFPAAPRWSNSWGQRSNGRDQRLSGRGEESRGRGESLSHDGGDDASYFGDAELEKDLEEQGKRNVGMLRMGKRPVGILRMGRSDDSGEMDEGEEDLGENSTEEGEEPTADEDDMERGSVGMVQLGKRPVELLRMGKRPVGLLRMGKRPVGLLRMGKRPVGLLRMGKRPVGLLRMGKRPVGLLRMGKRPVDLLRMG